MYGINFLGSLDHNFFSFPHILKKKIVFWQMINKIGKPKCGKSLNSNFHFK